MTLEQWKVGLEEYLRQAEKDGVWFYMDNNCCGCSNVDLMLCSRGANGALKVEIP